MSRHGLRCEVRGTDNGLNSGPGDGGRTRTLLCVSHSGPELFVSLCFPCPLGYLSSSRMAWLCDGVVMHFISLLSVLQAAELQSAQRLDLDGRILPCVMNSALPVLSGQRCRF